MVLRTSEIAIIRQFQVADNIERMFQDKAFLAALPVSCARPPRCHQIGLYRYTSIRYNSIDSSSPPNSQSVPITGDSEQSPFDPLKLEPQLWGYMGGLEEVVRAHPKRISNRFAPSVLADCASTMPSWYAPCVAWRHLHGERIYAEELIYPDFTLPIPTFGREEDRERWMSRVPEIANRGTPRAAGQN